jgi:hypothetical protein
MGIFQIHRYISDPAIRAAFERAERDLPPVPATLPDPRPVLTGGAVAQEMEAAYA